MDSQGFEKIVRDVIGEYPQIKILDIINGTVHAAVKSHSGKSTWEFTLFFNEKGLIDGEWSYWCGMLQTNLPKFVGRAISTAIKRSEG